MLRRILFIFLIFFMKNCFVLAEVEDISRLKIFHVNNKKTTPLEEKLENINELIRKQKYAEAISLCEEILKKDATNRKAVKYIRIAKRRYFWQRYGNTFILVIALLFIVPTVFKFISGISVDKGSAYKSELSKIRDIISSGNYKKAIKRIERLIKNSDIIEHFTLTELGMLYFNLGKSYLKTGDRFKAIKYLKESLKFDTNNNITHDLLAKCYLIQKATHEQAIREYQHYFKYHPQDIEVVRLLAIYYSEKGIITDDALTIYRKYLTIDSNNQAIIKLLAKRFLRKMETSKEAAEIYKKLLRFEPNNFKVMRALVNIHFAYKKYEDVINLCHKLFESKLYVEDEELHKIFEEVHHKLGRFDELKLYYENLIKRFEDSEVLKEISSKIIGTAEDIKFVEQIGGDDNASDFIICPHCAHLNSRDDEYCQGCGKIIKKEVIN